MHGSPLARAPVYRHLCTCYAQGLSLGVGGCRGAVPTEEHLEKLRRFVDEWCGTVRSPQSTEHFTRPALPAAFAEVASPRHLHHHPRRGIGSLPCVRASQPAVELQRPPRQQTDERRTEQANHHWGWGASPTHAPAASSGAPVGMQEEGRLREFTTLRALKTTQPFTSSGRALQPTPQSPRQHDAHNERSDRAPFW